MKYVVVLSLLFMGFTVEAKKMSFEEAKAFLVDEKKRVLEEGVPPCRTPQDIAFLIFVAENWGQALTLLEKDAPDRRRQHLILSAAGVLPAQDYVRFIDGACALMESEKIKVPGEIFCFSDFIKEGFWGYNYDLPEVAAVVDRMEAIYKVQEPGRWEGYFSEIKSKEGKQLAIQESKYNGGGTPESYKANSKEVYNALVKEHKELLAEEAKKAKGKIKPESAPKERKTVRIAEEDGSVRITLMDDDPPEDEPVEDNVMSWKLPFVIGTLVISSIAVAWHCFRKKKKCKN